MTPSIKHVAAGITLVISGLGATAVMADDFVPDMDDHPTFDGSSDPLCATETNVMETMLTNVCWTCIAPILVGNQRIFSESSDNTFAIEGEVTNLPPGTPEAHVAGVPPDRGDIPVSSHCDDTGFCFTTGMWNPYRIVEFTRNPGCSRALGGMDLTAGLDAVTTSEVNMNWGTYAGGGDPGEPVSTYFNYHMFAFPITQILSMVSFSECTIDQLPDLDLIAFSEVDPTWNNPDLAYHVTPENAAVANPLASLSCAGEGVAASLGRPINNMFWCAGTWGNMFPINGHTAHANKPAQETAALFASRAMYISHRRGMSMRVYKADTLCKPRFDMQYPKAQYRWQLLGPIPDATRAIWTGAITARWAAGRTLPHEIDPILLMFRWEDCCVNNPYSGGDSSEDGE